MDSLISRLLNSGAPFAILEDTRNPDAKPACRLFTHPCGEALARRPDEIEAALAKLEAAGRAGLYACGYISYECGYHFQDRQRFSFKQNKNANTPLLQFVFFEQCETLSAQQIADLLAATGRYDETAVYYSQFNISPTEYTRNVQRIQELIRDGESYQVNFTYKQRFAFSGTPLALYKALRDQQQVEYAAFLNFADLRVLSFSPELFLRRDGNQLTARPMKGTLPSTSDPASLAQDAKNRAENVMIVDLLRNDIGRLAETGTVQAQQLFTVETFATLHQMTSTVCGAIPAQTNFAQILRNLFPCGSITGAPKIRSMEIIEELENSPRGIYSGAIGFISPNQDFCFNVAIRTIVSRNPGHAEMGVGSGIVADSTPTQEYAECVLKGRFLANVNTGFEIIESMRQKNGHIEHLDLHINRLATSAMAFGFKFERARLVALLWNLMLETSEDERRVRVALRQDGSMSLDRFPLPTQAGDERHKVLISATRIDARSIFRRHKTTRRQLYENEYERACASGAYEILFFNELGFLAEASRHNVLLEIDGQLFTPPLEDGALPGIMRHVLLNTPKRNLREQHLTLEDLQRADRIILCNAVRGETEVVLSL